VFFLGNYMRFEQGLYQGYTPPRRPNMVELQSNVSEGGHLLGSAVIRRGIKTTASLSHFERGTIRSADFDGFVDHFNEGKGFFWCWRPNLGAGEMWWSWRDGGEISPTNTGPRRYMGFDMSMRHYVDVT